MPSEESRPTYSFQKIEGHIAVEMSKVVLVSDLAVGDPIVLFTLPDGKFLVEKTEESDIKVGRLSSAYLYLDGEVQVTKL